ncbi:hypothetical protein [Acidianus sp. RZ1]|uniref:hypothetical protein n=1 Tax=Acidianus sp. RZ1 TaxID=1540082 RepID=UPI0014909793|nr:hypothetical protein [Acidianus sp. RZ1]NON61890.1 hypothetical protein [Acidianus sp. RZ1]
MSLESGLWTIYDLQLPLVEIDFSTYLLKEGYISQEDIENFNKAKALVRESYYLNRSNEVQIIEKLKEALSLLESIKPKKPFPPEMKIRFEELKRAIKEVLEKRDQGSS